MHGLGVLLLCRGDVPLWGAALSLVEHKVHFLRLPYVHGSHDNIVIDDNSKSGAVKYSTPLQLIVYADNLNTTLNTRITVGVN